MRMKHQLLHRARGAVLGRPRLELIVMGQEQLGQVLGILGAAGDEGLTKLLERDPVIAFEKGDEMDGGLFQTFKSKRGRKPSDLKTTKNEFLFAWKSPLRFQSEPLKPLHPQFGLAS
jgi:hypothetical protein